MNWRSGCSVDMVFNSAVRRLIFVIVTLAGLPSSLPRRPDADTTLLRALRLSAAARRLRLARASAAAHRLRLTRLTAARLRRPVRHKGWEAIPSRRYAYKPRPTANSACQGQL